MIALPVMGLRTPDFFVWATGARSGRPCARKHSDLDLSTSLDFDEIRHHPIPLMCKFFLHDQDVVSIIGSGGAAVVHHHLSPPSSLPPPPNQRKMRWAAAHSSDQSSPPENCSHDTCLAHCSSCSLLFSDNICCCHHVDDITNWVRTCEMCKCSLLFCLLTATSIVVARTIAAPGLSMPSSQGSLMHHGGSAAVSSISSLASQVGPHPLLLGHRPRLLEIGLVHEPHQYCSSNMNMLMIVMHNPGAHIGSWL